MHNLKVREYNCHFAKLFTPLFIQVSIIIIIIIIIIITVITRVLITDPILGVHLDRYPQHGDTEA